MGIILHKLWNVIIMWIFSITCSSVISEVVGHRCSVKKVFLEISQNSQENTCARTSFLIMLHASASNFIKKETLAQVFSWEFSEISKSTFSYRTPPVAASVTCITTAYTSFSVFTISKKLVYAFAKHRKKQLWNCNWNTLSLINVRHVQRFGFNQWRLKKWSFPLEISSVNEKLRKLRLWSHLLKKFLIKNFIFCAVYQAAGLFKYVWPFCYHQALKDYFSQDFVKSMTFGIKIIEYV